MLAFTSQTRQRVKRASKANPCPVCGADGCGLTARFIYCHRVANANDWRADGTDAWIHDADNIPNATEWAARLAKPIVQSASLERRHAVYTALLEKLALSDAHREHLTTARRIPVERIEAQSFRSMPDRQQVLAICAQLAQDNDLNRVPGFYQRDDQQWALRFAGISGFLIPLRDLQGRIQALQLRSDSTEHKHRYLMLSTPDDEFIGGAKSNAPSHFVGNPESSTAIITEGGLKAEVCAANLPPQFGDVLMIGLVAVSTFGRSFGWQLRTWLPKLGKIGIAFDADWRTNPKVREQHKRLTKALTEAGYSPDNWEWPAEKGKGIDDFLLRGEL